MNIALVGASHKPNRIAYTVFKRLFETGHRVFLVHPIYPEIDGHPVYKKLSDIPEKIDTVTLYINAEKSTSLTQDLLALNPRRVIFNPGAENPELAKTLQNTGIQTLEACSLVLLNTGQF